jgi:hypothetical protein
MTNTEKTNNTEMVSTISALERTSNILSVRHIKTYSFHRESRSKCLHKPRPKVLPLIRLCGNWLQEAGFIIDQDLTITVMKDMLVIRPTKEV